MPSTQHDQAAGLRQLMTGHEPKVFSVLSTMPSQHQPKLIANLAASLSLQGSDVLVVQTEKVDLNHYGVKSLPALSDVVDKKLRLEHAVKSSKFGFLATQLHAKQPTKAALDSVGRANLNQTFEELSRVFEVVLVDANLDSKHQLPLNALNQHKVLIQLSCEAESIKAAYTLIKRVYNQVGRRSFGIIINNASDEQAAATFRNISQVARNYMQVDLEFFGAIPRDQHLSRASKLGRVVVDAFPLTKASKALKALAQRLNYKYPQTIQTEIASFV